MLAPSPLEIDAARLNLGSGTWWANLGYWEQATTYPQACAALADQLAQAADLQPGDHLLDVGFGYGQQIIHWHERYGVAQVDGLEITPAHYEQAVRLVAPRYPADRLILGSTFPVSSRYDKIVALDCAYHFVTRANFFEAAYHGLKPGGRLALADITLKNDCPAPVRALFAVLSSTLLIPRANLVTLATYQAQLQACGFQQVAVRCIEAQVFPGYARFIATHARLYQTQNPAASWRKLIGAGTFFRLVGRWLHYVIVTAQPPDDL